MGRGAQGPDTQVEWANVSVSAWAFPLTGGYSSLR